MSQPTRAVDTHQHVFWHGKDDHGLVADMDANRIEYAWLLSWEIMPAENNSAYYSFLNPIHARADGTLAGIPLSDLLKARDHYPERFLVGYCPHPCSPHAPELLRAAAGIHDVRVGGEWKFRVPFDDPRCIELYKAAGELNLPVVLHLDVPWLVNAQGQSVYQPDWYGGTIENLERALQACPRTRFIGHAPGFWREISADAAGDPALYPKGPVRGEGRLYGLLDRNANLFADLSAGSGRTALQRDPENAKKFIARYADRLLFGRDIYGAELRDFLGTLQLSAELTEKIYHQNAEKLVPRKP